MTNDAAPRLYTSDEWARMSEHDREVVADYRRREVEAARLAHMARRQLLDSLTEERFGR